MKIKNCKIFSQNADLHLRPVASNFLRTSFIVYEARIFSELIELYYSKTIEY